MNIGRVRVRVFEMIQQKFLLISSIFLFLLLFSFLRYSLFFSFLLVPSLSIHSVFRSAAVQQPASVGCECQFRIFGFI